ncbi:Eaa1 [Klebsiella michiganensis]|nr:Eaa1 [Klebsiella michiganensis]
MVPKEATEKMLIAGLEEANPLGGLIDWDASRGDCNTRAQVQGIFKAMLAAAPQPQNAPQNIPEIIPGWIPVSERMPENKPGCYKYLVFETLNNRVNNDYWNVPDKGDEAFTPFWNYYGEHVTHWMPLPAAPQEVSDA